MRFEANAGQTDSQVKFLSRGGGYDLFLTPAEAVMSLRKKKPASAKERQAVVRMKLVGANPAAQMEGVDALPGRSNYFIGNDPQKWRRNVTNYAKVRYKNAYPGIDLVYYGNKRQLEYDFVLQPGASPASVRLALSGAEGLKISANGDLEIQTGGVEVAQRKPAAYQEIDGRREEIACRYVMNGEREVGFELAPYDRSRRLVIDPVLVYSTYLGGSDDEEANSVAVDESGNAYVTGYTSSTDFPTEGPVQPVLTGVLNAFISKLNADGSALIYSTYLGGTGGADYSFSIKVDSQGNACIAGNTISPDFPTKNALQPTYHGNTDDFVAKLNADGSDLIYSTYLGGSDDEELPSLAMDSAGNAYVTGRTYSTDFPTKNALQPSLLSTGGAFVTKLTADGSEFVYSTYINGGTTEDIAVDGSGNVYLAGETSSVDFPTVNPIQANLLGSLDAFVTELNSAGAAIVFSTYLGGGGYDDARSIAIDGSGNIYLTGLTFSTDFPTANPFQPAFAGSFDAYVAKLDPIGATLIYSTYLGGSLDDIPTDIGVDSNGNAYLTGESNSPDFPTIDVLQPRPVKVYDYERSAFVTKLNSAGSGLVYSTFIGGNGADGGAGITLGADGAVYVTGYTASTDFITTPGAFQRELRSPITYSNSDSFILKITDQSEAEKLKRTIKGDAPDE